MNRVIFVLFFFVSCRNSNYVDSKDYLLIFEKGTDSTIKRTYDEEKRLVSTETKYFGAIYQTHFSFNAKALTLIKGYLLQNLYGHYFEFSEKGNVRFYCYYAGESNNSSYLLEYFDNGGLKNIKGSPFVDNMNAEHDSLDLFFSTVSLDSINVQISIDKKNYSPLKKRECYMQPMLVQSTVRIPDSLLFIKTQAYFKNGNQSMYFFDTVKIK